jgi:erythromycin esterase
MATVRMSLPGCALALAATLSACGRHSRSPSTTANTTAKPSAAVPAVLPDTFISDADPEVQRWVAEHAIPLVSVEPGHGFADMEPLRAVVGDARVVALGEATHGTREFFQLKHRMLEFLVTQMGFTLFGIEATMPEAFELNEYVLHGKGDPKKALTHVYFWTWNTEEVLAMIEWMRAYNADPAHTDKLEFYGFDMQSPPYAVGYVVDYLRVVDPSHARKVERALELLMDPFMLGLQADWKLAQRQRVTAAARALVRRFERRRADYIARSNAQAYELAAQHARVAADGAEVRVGAHVPDFSRLARVRDAAMAKNIEWILARRPGQKLVVWAHNGHVATAGEFPMGQELRKTLGSTMVVFGFAFYRGAFRARNWDSPSRELHDFTVPPAPRNSLDALLASTKLPVFALDLRETSHDEAAASWFAAEHETWSVGAVYSFALRTVRWREVTKDRYDALLYVENTTAARGIEPWGNSPAVAFLAAPTNLGFEALDAEGWPAAWNKEPQLAAFDVELATDSPGAAEGRRCATLRKARAGHLPVEWYPDVSQTLDATKYRDKRVRLARSRMRSTLRSGRARHSSSACRTTRRR